MRLTAIIISGILVLGSCKKDDGTILFRSAVTLDTPLHLQMDSMCLHVPNVITANGDAINDEFFPVFGELPQSHSLSISNPNDRFQHERVQGMERLRCRIPECIRRSDS